jgi:hypothetical protein
MPNRENYTTNKVVNLIRSQRITGTTTSSALDLSGIDAVEFIADIGASTLTPSTANRFVLTLTESSGSATGTSTGTYTTVASSDIIGNAATTDGAWGKVDSTAKVSKTYSASYIGGKRFVKAVATETGTASVQISVTAIGTKLASAPASTPVA